MPLIPEQIAMLTYIYIYMKMLQEKYGNELKVAMALS